MSKRVRAMSEEAAEESALVSQLGRLMCRKLAGNRHKSHWDGENPEWLLERAEEELHELQKAVESYSNATTPDSRARKSRKVAREAADVANFMAMIVDVTKVQP